MQFTRHLASSGRFAPQWRERRLVAGSDAEVRFVVGTQAFLANEWTKFSASPCDILADGATVRLRGVRMTDGVTVLATYIEALTQ